MKPYLASIMCAGLLWGCGNAGDSAAPLDNENPVIEAASVDTVSDDADFRDVLRQYQDLNTRLASVAYRLQKANAPLCPVTYRDTGFTVHMVTDYPETLQPIARELLSVSDRLSVRTVRENSSADAAGLIPSDEIAQVFGAYVPSGPSAKLLFQAASTRAFEADEAVLKIRRGGQVMDMVLNPETLCGYPVNVFFSERINGHTDGREVWITSELIRSEPNNVNLALVVAHEIAHAIAGHVNQTPTKLLELEADRMALIMLARAGYDIGFAIDDWQYAPRSHGPLDENSGHPSSAERLENFRAAEAEIEAKRRAGKPLTF